MLIKTFSVGIPFQLEEEVFYFKRNSGVGNISRDLIDMGVRIDPL